MKIAARIVAAIALLAGVLWFGGRCYLARSVAQQDGIVKTSVAAPVEITFDAKGIPQVWAKTDADAYFAIGWLHASERLFQMELVRRLARGELSEVFGEAAFDTDAAQRRAGFARRATADLAAMNPRSRALVQRYVEGINAWIAQATLLPPEFVVLRIAPRPWDLIDCLAISGYQTWFSHELMDQDRRYQKILAKLGMPATTLMHAGHPWSPPTVPDLRITGASNSWAVTPSRSASGAALHASDPHLAVDQAPGLWYLAGLHSEEGLNVVGVTYGGAPFVVMGHNDAIAFSFTVSSVDVIDYFDDAPRTTIAREAIRVKGEDEPRIVDVKRGARGVMLDEKTSMHWAGFDFSSADLLEAALRLQRAQTFDDFRRAVTRFGALDANWIYSDRAGNIGYQLGTPIPIRDYDSYVRQDARDPKTVWRGYRELEETPHALNPPQGFLASCNNQIVSREWPYAIPGFYDPYRITRANALLNVATGFSPSKGGLKPAPTLATRDDMHAMQLDLVSGLALRWKDLAIEGADAEVASTFLDHDGWDGRMSEDSKAALLFAAWWNRMAHAVFEDELGEDWTAGRVLLDEALTNNIAIDDRRTPQVESLRDISARAMREAVTIASDRTWGEASTLTVQHPLARVKLLDWWLKLNRGPQPAPGDNGTLNANFFSFREEKKEFHSRLGPSMRFVLDWSDVDAFTLNGALGQSGNPFSPHYDDFLDMMRRGEEWNVPFTKEKVYAKKASLLRLVP
ncbi:MAG TPA: penicillin acylase family protein [Thermoanaerobaculia bacterium]|nr:penicillin acylase family protein [Thermoanaerobaculia bacterium]